MKKPGAGHLLRMVIIQACLCLSLVSPCLAVEKGLPPVLPAVAVKNITYVVYDLKNGGIAKTFRGFLEAASELNWRVSVQNGNGDPAKVAAILAQTASQHVDGIVIGGFDASQYQPQLKALRSKGVILLGWHAADRPGPTGLLFNNITTDPETVARMALDVALNSGHAGIGMVIFTDQHFSIARRKTEAVLKLVKNC
jgi:ribose transport system substrate-binding protein